MTILPELIDKAVHILRDGDLVAFPTETVYGLGGNAKDDKAIASIFELKQRPKDHPLIVHIAHADELKEWVQEVPEAALKLAAAFWPGPLTMVLKKKEGVSSLLTGGYDTIAIRSPNHPVALNLLQSFGSGLAAPSANLFTHISPTTASAVYEEFGDSVGMILDGGSCKVGLESTIVDLSQKTPTILRPGMLGKEEIEAVLGSEVVFAKSHEQKKHAPGSHKQHYAPKTKTRLIETKDIAAYIQSLKAEDLPIVCVAYSHTSFPKVKQVEWVNMADDAKDYAHELYRTLRALDAENYKEILIEATPDQLDWLAIGDRLSRAAERIK